MCDDTSYARCRHHDRCHLESVNILLAARRRRQYYYHRNVALLFAGAAPCNCVSQYYSTLIRRTPAAPSESRRPRRVHGMRCKHLGPVGENTRCNGPRHVNPEFCFTAPSPVLSVRRNQSHAVFRAALRRRRYRARD